MKITAEYTFMEPYLPTPRCRKYRYREAEGTMEVEVKELTEQDAPVAMKVHQLAWDKDFNRYKKSVDYRFYNHQLYKPVFFNERVCDGEGFYPVDEFVNSVKRYGKYRVYCYGESRTKELVEQAIREYVDSHFILNGMVWTRTGEPRYVVNTFGLGHNHGGTAMFVETHYNPNIPKERYFNALEREKAITYANEIAKRRGDTKSIGTFGKYIDIEVLIPETVRCNPEKEHGDGCEFINRIEKAIENTDSVSEAGLTAVALTMAEINK